MTMILYAYVVYYMSRLESGGEVRSGKRRKPPKKPLPNGSKPTFSHEALHYQNRK